MRCWKEFVLLILFSWTVVESGLSHDSLHLKSAAPLNFADAIRHATAHRDFERLLTNGTFLNGLIKTQLSGQSLLFKNELLSTNCLTSLGKNSVYMNVSRDCISQINELIASLMRGSQWSFKVLDAFGKMPSGILDGNLAWLGEFDVCRNISALNDSWIGKYALISHPINVVDFFKPNLTTLRFKYGICVPNRCSQDDIYELISYMIQSKNCLSLIDTLPFKINISEADIQLHEYKKLDNAAIFTLCIVAFIVSIVFIGTFLDLFKRYQYFSQDGDQLAASHTTAEYTTLDSNLETRDVDRNDPLYFLSVSREPIFIQVMISFSLYSNCKKIFHVKNSDQMKCLDAIRVLSLAWVILGHTYIFVLAFSDNPIILVSWIKRFSMLVVTNAFFSVDTFFLLSGILTCYTFLKQVNRGNLSVGLMFKYYVHRFWRLTPSYMIAFLISANLTAFIGDGPQYPEAGLEPTFCNTTWWTNLLYVNNLVDTDRLCFGVSWYLANDMQFHWIAPVLLIPIVLSKRILVWLISSILLVGNIVAIALTLFFNPGLEQAQFGPLGGEFFTKFYILPWCRIGPFIIGMLTGYLIVTFKKGQAMKFPALVNVGFWCISILLCSLLVFGLYPDAQGIYPLSRATHIVYQSFGKIAWSLAVSYMIYSCVSQTGGFINQILSWKVWTPLSRLTYSAFLLHVNVIIYYNATQTHLIHIQDTTLVYFFVSHYVFSYVAAFVFTLFVEMPFSGLSRFIFKR